MSFDYQSSEVFGLNFKQHDARKIRHILKHYGELPESQGDRVVLFLRLQTLEKDLDQEVCDKIQDWMANGGELPSRRRAEPVLTHAEESREELSDGSHGGEEEEETSSSELSGISPDSGHEFQEGDEDNYPSLDYFEVNPTHPDNPDRGLYVFDSESSTSESEENLEDDEEEEDEEEEIEEEEEDDAEMEMETQTGGEATVELDTGYDAIDEADDESSPGNEVECVICAEMVPELNTWGRITSTCAHPDECRTCMPCLNTSITTDVEYGFLNRIKCPICPAILTYNDILHRASPDVFQRYAYLREKASRPDTFTMCLAPNCGGGQIHEGPEPLMICNHCKFKTCVRHRLPWHEGQSCDDFDIDDSQIERLEQEEATAKLLAKDSRICPQCQECVIRSEGCDHMQCRCGKSWCYLCGADWENILRLGATAHGRNCPNHPDSSKLSRNQIAARETHITELVHGGPVNERLNRARYAKNAARREALRPLALAAAEQRMKDQALAKAQAKSGTSPPPTKKAKLVAPWEEK
ncbi:hypothetical protein NHQ30_001301 [Ciborinia camelliae]|nr:hypothetical protein NHQ30_001301 [Ciborinia camelliae]